MATLIDGTTGAFATSNQGFPSVTQNATAQNFGDVISFAGNALLPENLETKVKRFGNRSISGLLSKMAAEYALNSSVINWTEDNHLHIKGTKGAVKGDSDATEENTITFDSTEGNPGYRAGNTIIIVNAAGTEKKAFVQSASSTEMVAIPYDTSATLHATYSTTADLVTIAYGSEFAKGTNGMVGSLETTYVDRTNNPFIMKDKFAVTGSDLAQKGWIEVSDPFGDGGKGYQWYLQSEIDERARFMDHIELSLVEAVPVSGSGTVKDADGNDIKGSRGLFHELDTYASTFTGTFDESSAAEALKDFDNIIVQLDTQGAIEENSLYLNKATSLKLDNTLGQQSSFGGSGNSGGPSWGSFANSKSMALNLGFDGWRRGGYDFYKTEWKYLNDVQGRGGLPQAKAINGIMCPMGSSNVYDEILSKTVTRPYLHVRYRAAEGENRRLKMFLTGSAGGASTNDLDAMEVHYLTERCLVTQAANNFAFFKQA